jgi:hypothetical protein
LTDDESKIIGAACALIGRTRNPNKKEQIWSVIQEVIDIDVREGYTDMDSMRLVERLMELSDLTTAKARAIDPKRVKQATARVQYWFNMQIDTFFEVMHEVHGRTSFRGNGTNTLTRFVCIALTRRIMS